MDCRRVWQDGKLKEDIIDILLSVHFVPKKDQVCNSKAGRDASNEDDYALAHFEGM